MGAKFRRERHQVIAEILERFDPKFLEYEGIGFGGGTRIALELDEYRESADIDFLCPTTASYRAVRETVNSHGLGLILRQPLVFAREVLADRYGVRTAIEYGGYRIKLEFLSFEDWDLPIIGHPLFPVPVLDQSACFTTKLTAANDRGLAAPYKDVFDLLAMRLYWGEPPACAIAEAERHYGRSVIQKAGQAVEQVLALPKSDRRKAADALGIEAGFLQRLESSLAVAGPLRAGHAPPPP